MANYELKYIGFINEDGIENEYEVIDFINEMDLPANTDNLVDFIELSLKRTHDFKYTISQPVNKERKVEITFLDGQSVMIFKEI